MNSLPYEIKNNILDFSDIFGLQNLSLLSRDFFELCNDFQKNNYRIFNPCKESESIRDVDKEIYLKRQHGIHQILHYYFKQIINKYRYEDQLQGDNEGDTVLYVGSDGKTDPLHISDVTGIYSNFTSAVDNYYHYYSDDPYQYEDVITSVKIQSQEKYNPQQYWCGKVYRYEEIKKYKNKNGNYCNNIDLYEGNRYYVWYNDYNGEIFCTKTIPNYDNIEVDEYGETIFFDGDYNRDSVYNIKIKKKSGDRYIGDKNNAITPRGSNNFKGYLQHRYDNVNILVPIKILELNGF